MAQDPSTEKLGVYHGRHRFERGDRRRAQHQRTIPRRLTAARDLHPVRRPPGRDRGRGPPRRHRRARQPLRRDQPVRELARRERQVPRQARHPRGRAREGALRQQPGQPVEGHEQRPRVDARAARSHPRDLPGVGCARPERGREGAGSPRRADVRQAADHLASRLHPRAELTPPVERVPVTAAVTGHPLAFQYL